MRIEDEIRDKLGTKRCVEIEGRSVSGCISSGSVYEVDDGKIFVKKSRRENAVEMLEGEMVSLKRIGETESIRVPVVFSLVVDPTDSATHGLVMEYIHLNPLDKCQSQLGDSLGHLHKHNIDTMSKHLNDSGFIGRFKNNQIQHVDSFGFNCTTNCGYIPLVNEWHGDWVSFFARNRLDVQIRMIQNRTVDELWSQLQLNIPKIFSDFKERDIQILPSLLHGDLWSGNAGETKVSDVASSNVSKVASNDVSGENVSKVGESVDGAVGADGGVKSEQFEPVVFDPASFYGHSEFDLAIAQMFGGFRKSFYDSYFKVMKQVPGMESRMDLYQLFHYLNHWNHFGSGYSSKSINLMKKLNKLF